MTPSLRGQVMRQMDWSTLSLSLQWIYEDEVPLDGHGRTNNCDLGALLVVRGTAEVCMDDSRMAKASEGEWLILPPGFREQIFSEGTRILSVSWRARWPDGRPLFDRGLPITIKAERYPQLRRTAQSLMRMANSCYNDVPEPVWRSKANARITADSYIRGELRLLTWVRHLIHILDEVGVSPAIHDIPDDRLLNALEIMETIPLHRMLSVQQLAKKAGLSMSQFKRLFVQHLGHSPNIHLRERRLSEARSLLSRNDLPIKEIAYSLGFPSQGAFYNWFKKHEGIRPGAVLGEQDTGSPVIE